ncbi:FAD binding domain-containing protein [Chachezhania sediminis]|uniref:FAD binding domain-containing protein n=1 Tax=Chachezhania sediminis TaxID=2599291 RepID=UPI00131B65BE|nr:xanthine dehydrogenase family protein subunit M [Chachezhania sediminis]
MLYRPESLDAALALMAEPGAVLLAGGTDVYPALRDGMPPDRMIDLTRVADLRGIALADGTWRIGGATTWTDIVKAELPPRLAGLQLAGREVGSIQIQNAGTVAGNICNASPAADGVPALMALDAAVEIAGPEGLRTLPLHTFLKGPRQTDLQPGEIVTALLIPDGPGRGAFLKLGARKYLVISIAMISAVVEIGAGKITNAAVAVGACSPVARRLTALEAQLTGATAADIPALCAKADLSDLSPITDVRASADYRGEAVPTLVARTVLTAMEAPHVA